MSLSKKQVTTSDGRTIQIEVEYEPLAIDYDGKWKSLIEVAFEYFVKFFLLKIYHEIDFTKPITFLKQDAPEMAATKGKKGDKIMDNLVKVYLKNGREKILYIHIEVQGYKNENFGKRMYIYFGRIYDKFPDADVTALAIFVSERLPKNHNSYEYQFGDTKIRYEYPAYVIRGQKEEELLKSDNPFALAVLTCLKVLEIRKQCAKQPTKDAEFLERLQARKYLLKLLQERQNVMNFPKEIIVALMEVIINILVVPDKYEVEFREDLKYLFTESDKSMETSTRVRNIVNDLFAVYYGDTAEDTLKKLEEKSIAIKKMAAEHLQYQSIVKKELQRSEQEKQKAEQEKQKAEQEKQKAEQDKQKVEQDKQKAEQDKQKAEQDKQKAEQDKQKIEQEILELLEKQKFQILNLHNQLRFNHEQIAEILGFEKEFVQKVLKEKEQENLTNTDTDTN